MSDPLEQHPAHGRQVGDPAGTGGTSPARAPGAPGEGWKLALGWLVVGIPAAWGVAQVVVKSLALFR